MGATGEVDLWVEWGTRDGMEGCCRVRTVLMVVLRLLPARWG